MTKVGLAKAILAITGIVLFLWARDDDQAQRRWVAIGLIVAAWMLRVIEHGSRRKEDSQAND